MKYAEAIFQNSTGSYTFRNNLSLKVGDFALIKTMKGKYVPIEITKVYETEELKDREYSGMICKLPKLTPFI
jgi:hypothetical protein